MPERSIATVLRPLAVAIAVSMPLAVPGAGVASPTPPAPSATTARRAATSTLNAATVRRAATSTLNAAAATSRALARTSTAARSTPTPAPKPKAAAKRPVAQPPPGPLMGWLAQGVRFPDRTLVLSAPAATVLAPGQVHVTENGGPVRALTLTSVAHGGAGDLGVMFVVDQNTSMTGAPIAAAISAIRSFTAQRAGAEAVGLIAFGQSPNLILAPTGDQPSISAALAQNLGTGTSADVPAATSLALSELVSAKVALGAVVVISDGVGAITAAGGPSATSVQGAAAAADVPIFTVGLKDAASSAASLITLRAASPGQFEASTQAGLPRALQSIFSALSRGYIVRYRSRQGASRPVSVTATAKGVSGAVDVAYQSPAAPSAVKPLAPGRAAPARPSSASVFTGAALLSAWPSFAPGGVPVAAAQTTQTHAALPLPLAAGLFGLLVALAIMFAIRRPQRAVQDRVFNFIPGENDDPSYPELLLPGEQGRGFTHLLERGTWWSPFVENVEIARIKTTPSGLVKRALIIGAILALLLGVVSGTPALGLLPLLFCPIALRMFVKRAARKQREMFINALPGYLQDLASALRVGRSFAGALAVVAATADEPVRSELERAITDESLGRPLEDSLARVAVRMQATDMEQVALVAALNSRSGSNVAEALDRVAEGARDRGDMRREIKALTGQAKMSSSVLTGLPPVVLLFMSFISPSYARPLFHTTIGIGLLIVSALMVAAGWKVMKKISMVKA